MEADYELTQWRELTDVTVANNTDLGNIRCHLDLVLLALEAIADITSEAIIQAAKELNLESIIGEGITQWRLKSANPQRRSSERGKKLDVEEARALVIVICHLANQHQELIRRAVCLLEQVSVQNQPPHQTALLGSYLDKFINYYQERIAGATNISITAVSALAWKLLIALLFYSGNNGHRLLWFAIFDAAEIAN